MSHVLLAARDDAADLRDRILALLSGEDATICSDLTAFPDPDEAAVALVVLSPQALADPAITAFVSEIVRRKLPLVPVVEDRDRYDFSAVTIPEIDPLSAVGWQPGDGGAILATVRGYLGLEAFPRKKKVFISYRRQDGEEIAQRIYKYLRRHEYEPFLDVFQIEGGVPVQPRIIEEIADKDFVLLIDTPMARCSRWVRAEIVETLNQRIPVRALSVDQDDAYPLLPYVERLTWKAGDRTMMRRLRDFISRGIAASASFDARCHRVLEGVAEAKGLCLRELDRRRFLIAGRGRRALVEYERALPSLERLHRLYQGYRKSARGPALLISGDQPIPEPTLEAVDWARGRAPLQVLALHDLKSLLDVIFA